MRPEIADHSPATWIEYPGLRSEVQYFCDGCGAEIGFDEGRNVCGDKDLGFQFLQEHWADLGIIEGDEEEVEYVEETELTTQDWGTEILTPEIISGRLKYGLMLGVGFLAGLLIVVVPRLIWGW